MPPAFITHDHADEFQVTYDGTNPIFSGMVNPGVWELILAGYSDATQVVARIFYHRQEIPGETGGDDPQAVIIGGKKVTEVARWNAAPSGIQLPSPVDLGNPPGIIVNSLTVRVHAAYALGGQFELTAGQFGFSSYTIQGRKVLPT